MCTSSEQREIKLVVDKFVGNNFMFTAYDVTKTVRARGIDIKHADVRDEVRRLFRNGVCNYTNTVVDVGNSNGAPFVYHLMTDDPNVYEPTWLETDPDQKSIPRASLSGTPGSYIPATASAGPAPVSPSPVTVPSTDGSAPSPFARTRNPYKKSVTKDGRLQISSVLVKKINTTGSAWLYLYEFTGNLVIRSVPSHHFGETFVQEYEINKDKRIRISHKTLKNVFTGDPKNFEIAEDTLCPDEITVKAI